MIFASRFALLCSRTAGEDAAASLMDASLIVGLNGIAGSPSDVEEAEDRAGEVVVVVVESSEGGTKGRALLLRPFSFPSLSFLSVSCERDLRISLLGDGLHTPKALDIVVCSARERESGKVR